MENILMLIGAAAIAYILNKIINLLYKRTQIYNYYNKSTKNDLAKFKFKKVNEKVHNYFYTMAVTMPELLAKNLAKEHMINLFHQNKIDDLYSSIKNDEKQIKTDRPCLHLC